MSQIIAFTSGCFDILHRGHLRLFKQMNALGEDVQVIVALNSDDYIRRKKNREPINFAPVRVRNLYLTGLVDDVIEFDEDTPLNLILKYRPHYIAVGNDYSMDQIAGAKEAMEWGGKVLRGPRTIGLSTTKIIEKKEKR